MFFIEKNQVIAIIIKIGKASSTKHLWIFVQHISRDCNAKNKKSNNHTKSIIVMIEYAIDSIENINFCVFFFTLSKKKFNIVNKIIGDIMYEINHILSGLNIASASSTIKYTHTEKATNIKNKQSIFREVLNNFLIFCNKFRW